MAEECTFCRIINGELPADFVHQSDNLVVFKDINPHSPVHLLIVPRRHIRSINDITPEDADILAEMAFTGRDMAKRMETHESGYRLLYNVERGGGQVIFHLHMHLLGGFDRR
ncbi:MAG: histidine triad nucleotide-binding protein [Desulfatibacillaceae bacterium]